MLQTRISRSLVTATILLVLQLALWFSKAVRAADSATTGPPPIISVIDCIDTLEKNDRNGDGYIDQVEFKNFLVQLDHPYNKSDCLLSFDMWNLYLQASCICLSHDVNQFCCVLPSVRLNTDRKYKNGYYKDICTLVSDKIEQECMNTPSPLTNVTNTSATTNGTDTNVLKEIDTTSTTEDDGSSNNTVDWKIYVFIPVSIFFILYVWLLTIFLCDDKKKKKQQQQKQTVEATEASLEDHDYAKKKNMRDPEWKEIAVIY